MNEKPNFVPLTGIADVQETPQLEQQEQPQIRPLVPRQGLVCGQRNQRQPQIRKSLSVPDFAAGDQTAKVFIQSSPAAQKQSTDAEIEFNHKWSPADYNNKNKMGTINLRAER